MNHISISHKGEVLEFHYEIMKKGDYFENYTQKMIDFFDFKIDLTKDEFLKEESIDTYSFPDQFIQVSHQSFLLLIHTLDKGMIPFEFIISPYKLECNCHLVYPKSKHKEFEYFFKDLNVTYALYEHLFTKSEERVRIVSTYGSVKPKHVFEKIHNRIISLK